MNWLVSQTVTHWHSYLASDRYINNVFRYLGEVANDPSVVLLQHFDVDPRVSESATSVYDWSENGHATTCSQTGNTSTCPSISIQGKFAG